MPNRVTIAHFNPAIIEAFAQKWGKKQKSALALKMAQLGLADRMKLVKSVGVKVNKRFGQVDSITFRYLYYGFFHEHGATNVFGKDVNLPAQNWQSSTLNPEIEKLADEIAGYYATVAVANITDNT